ncbi:hypothetical protein DPMN_073265 [Dreissena polymorpha]|uniref:Uncharacterized protein n=1 Tax=Dreissena polymorpha TaxID=45954 RepID=A0A9D4HCV1_DREPO|nr:hypothetical protein DPMN_073265 [Dreissena polymorpha]
MRNFERYEPLDSKEPQRRLASSVPVVDFSSKHMVLDGVTLANLDVTENGTTGTTEGTLLARLDTCHTPFGQLQGINVGCPLVRHNGYMLLLAVCWSWQICLHFV